MNYFHVSFQQYGSDILCNLNRAVGVWDVAPAGAGSHTTAYWKSMGSREDRLDPAFAERKASPGVDTSYPRHRSLHRVPPKQEEVEENRVRTREKLSALKEPGPIGHNDMILEYKHYLYARNPDYTTHNMEYGKRRADSRGIRRAGKFPEQKHLDVYDV
jgi:hypothetical protein